MRRHSRTPFFPQECSLKRYSDLWPQTFGLSCWLLVATCELVRRASYCAIESLSGSLLTPRQMYSAQSWSRSYSTSSQVGGVTVPCIQRLCQ